jgi:shikimate kinase
LEFRLTDQETSALSALEPIRAIRGELHGLSFYALEMFQIPQRKVYLIGLMGAGKTTVGRWLARRMGFAFADLDLEIEQRTGVRIPIIFEMESETGFRDRETRMLKELVDQDYLVLATGGGVVLRPENRDLLKANGTVIYLNATPAVLYERTRRSNHRPLLNVPNPLERLQELHTQRDPLYRDIADVIIDTKPGAVSAIARQIESELSKCVT